MRRIAVLLLGLVLLGGCAGVELAPQPTSKVEFSGIWLIDFSGSDSVPDLRHRTGGKTSRRRVRGAVNREALKLFNGSGLAFVVHDFQVLKADKLDIEQGRDSMGVQYSPGVYRDISWGERQRGLWEVQAGWQENDLLVISQAKDLRVVEQFSRPSENRLIVTVNITADDEDMVFVRRFYRQPSLKK